MKLARELERRLERLVDGTTSAVFRGRMHPVEIADRLIRQVDFLKTSGDGGPEIPNRLEVRINRSDLDVELDVDELARELTYAVEAIAAERGWRTRGPVQVEVVADDATPRGLVECVGRTEAGDRPYWGQLIADDGRTVVTLRDNRIVIGRALDADAIVPFPEVSRHHALVVREADGIHLTDLDSANGTFHNGRRVGDEPVKIVPGDEIVLARIPFVFRTVG